jgi:hypothetical protein
VCRGAALAADRRSQTVQCGGLRRVVDVTMGVNETSEGGEVTANAADIDSCQSTCGAPPADGVGGESCRYWWAREPFDALSPFSNAIGLVLPARGLQARLEPRQAGRSRFPLRLRNDWTSSPRIGNPPHNDEEYFWCVRQPPPMLVGAICGINRAHARLEAHVDRLVDHR